jgi:lactate dehydrogenase-like 2-hydroxyacid dehydrogenase
MYFAHTPGLKVVCPAIKVKKKIFFIIGGTDERKSLTVKLPSSVIAKLSAVADVDLYTGEGAITPDELRARVAGKDALVCLLTDAIDRTVIDAAPTLKAICNVAVGYNNIDVPYAKARGIVVTNTPDVLTESVADFTWALILAITRRLSEGERLVRRNEWKGWALDLLLGMELRGKQLGLVGLGRIGRAVAARASAFGMKVAYHSRNKQSGVSYNYYDKPVQLARDVKILVVACPGGKETERIVSREVIEALGKDGYLINVSRGSTIDEPALVDALVNGRLAGAGLDVFAAEPKVPQALLKLDNVVLQPHVSSGTHWTRAAMGQLVVDNLAAYLAGKPLLTQV